MSTPRTLFDKIWSEHLVAEGPDGYQLLAVDRLLLFETSTRLFQRLEKSGRTVRRPDLIFASADHFVPTDPGSAPTDADLRSMIDSLAHYTKKEGIRYLAPGDPLRGILHVVGPELGLTLPGALLVCGDSHTTTHGAFGCLAFGIGSSEVEHVLATQALWHKKPRTMRIVIEGALGEGVTAKDLALALIASIGTAGATGYALEYAGSTVRALSLAGRMTLCNLSIEAGARIGIVAPDEKTWNHLRDAPLAPKGELWEQALRHWKELQSDPGAEFDQELFFPAVEIAPTVTWGTSPEHAIPIHGLIPDPALSENGSVRVGIERALSYMGLSAGTRIEGLAIDRVFIGSCTNGRIEDLRAAAAVAKGRRAQVPAWVVPGSGQVKRMAEAEGLDRIFREAGFQWREAGCSMCVGMNGEVASERERVASTSNRNFEGRQGRGARTHLMSPPMAAAAAVTGRIVDVRALMKGTL